MHHEHDGDTECEGNGAARMLKVDTDNYPEGTWRWCQSCKRARRARQAREVPA